MTLAKSAHKPIPSLPGLPIVGNLFDIQHEVPIRGLERLIETCGPIARYHTFNGNDTIVIGSVEMLEELLDEKRFWKKPAKSLTQFRNSKLPRSLFAAESEDAMDWQQAHRVLMPVFGPLAIQNMFDEMVDIASQLVLKFARLGSEYRILVTSDFTKLTLDTIALCTMDYRFNSFYQDALHPFVDAMNNFLAASSNSSSAWSILQRILPGNNIVENAQKDFQYLYEVGRRLVQVRRDSPTGKPDILNAMINGKDPKTGDQMSDDLICANMVSFLVAGHETTSGLLSFCFYLLLKHPKEYFEVQAEIDRVVGKDKLAVHHLQKLHYVTAVLRETLRLYPTAPAFIRGIRSTNPNDIEAIGKGQYAITRAAQVVCLIGKVHRDPEVYGDDANDFKPARMLDEAFRKRSEAAWKPFGTGVRSCIGRAFAWQEAQICLAMLLQNFNFRLDDPSYQLKIKQALTIKPEGLYMRATLREGRTATTLGSSLLSPQFPSDELESAAACNTNKSPKSPMTVLYGSNTMTCSILAQNLVREAGRYGYHAAIRTMDEAVGNVPRIGPVIIITSSYNGEPPDNAVQFVEWLRQSNDLTGLLSIPYAVFGCGHTDWVNTYQKIPTLVDDKLSECGGKRLTERGIGNAAVNNLIETFSEWSSHCLWPALGATETKNRYARSHLNLEIIPPGENFQSAENSKAAVVKSSRLTALHEPEKRCLELELPPDVTYDTGDYLSIVPSNPIDLVHQLMSHFKIPRGAHMIIRETQETFLPTNRTIPVVSVLQDRVEISKTLSKADLESCISACEDTKARDELLNLAGIRFSDIAADNVSLIDLLIKYPSIKLSFGSFLSMLHPIRPRYYSISSSALANPVKCTLTYGVLRRKSQFDSRSHDGISGLFLSSLKFGDKVSVSVHSTNKHFRLPPSIESTPIVMIGAGTGLAPFRAFIEERALMKSTGRNLAPALLLLGCRSSTSDRLYGEWIDAQADAGVVDVRYAFSQEPDRSSDCRYVQDRLWKERLDVLRLWREGAKAFVCGSSKVAAGVERVAVQILQEARKEQDVDMTEKEALAWYHERRNERFVVDVFM